MSNVTIANPPAFLRFVLAADAASCFAMGVLLLAGAGMIDELLGLPGMLLRAAGMTLLPFAAVLAWLATRPTPPRAGVIAVIVCNVVWVAESVILLTGGWFAPSAWGVAFVLTQAAAVSVLTVLEYVGLRGIGQARR